MKDTPFRIETVSIGKLKATLWEHIDGRIVAVINKGENVLETQGFETLSGARSFAYFYLLRANGAKRI